MTPTMERNAAESRPERCVRPSLVLVVFDTLAEQAPTPKPIPAPTRSAMKDRLYEYGTIVWMASIVVAIAACMARL